MSEIEKILRTNELVESLPYPNVLSSNNILGLFIEDDKNSPDINIGDRVYVNKNWNEGILFNNIANEEKIIKSFRDSHRKTARSNKKVFNDDLICGKKSFSNFDDEYLHLFMDIVLLNQISKKIN